VRQPGNAPQRGAERYPQDHGAFGKIDHEQREPDAEPRQYRAAVLQGKGRGDRHCGHERRGHEALCGAEQIAALPAEQRSAIQACTASALALSLAGRLLPKAATSAPNSAKMEIHSIMDPSWFPQTLVK